MKILVTGASGFIGYYLTKKIMNHESDHVIGLDSINNYYDPNLKYSRLKQNGIKRENIDYNLKIQSQSFENYEFVKINLEDKENILSLFHKEKFDIVIHLAAQAGVRYSLENPYAYIDSNIAGFLHILEGCRQTNVKHLIYASSSSVYGMNTKMPFSVYDNVDYPVSLYAATKKSNELMAHTYSHLYNMPVTGLRFFTVYGPWGRPDMAYFSFTKAILENKPIKVFNNGNLRRDFTYIDDIINGILHIIQAQPPKETNIKDSASKKMTDAPYRLYNIGNNQPVRLMDFIETIENALGKEAIKEMLPMQPGDVLATWADVDDLIKDFSYAPDTPLKEGIQNFVDWYKNYYSSSA